MPTAVGTPPALDRADEARELTERHAAAIEGRDAPGAVNHAARVLTELDTTRTDLHRTVGPHG
ncbi:hypothetical protein AB0I39_19415 [Kitasatospora purpeofusca]|uniref:hypothetical protein n=1 Tax=Kitasatospora purpeofusca TaxID=67352 RepID=UPI0033F1D040